ncbi:unnamed protein product [Sympodiomycopsis kandeliae]
MSNEGHNTCAYLQLQNVESGELPIRHIAIHAQPLTEDHTVPKKSKPVIIEVSNSVADDLRNFLFDYFNMLKENSGPSAIRCVMSGYQATKIKPADKVCYFANEVIVMLVPPPHVVVPRQRRFFQRIDPATRAKLQPRHIPRPSTSATTAQAPASSTLPSISAVASTSKPKSPERQALARQMAAPTAKPTSPSQDNPSTPSSSPSKVSQRATDKNASDWFETPKKSNASEVSANPGQPAAQAAANGTAVSTPTPTNQGQGSSMQSPLERGSQLSKITRVGALEPGKTYHVVSIVVSIAEPRPTTSGTGGYSQQICLADESGWLKIQVFAPAIAELLTDVSQGDVLYIRGLYVQTWQGGSKSTKQGVLQHRRYTWAAVSSLSPESTKGTFRPTDAEKQNMKGWALWYRGKGQQILAQKYPWAKVRTTKLVEDITPDDKFFDLLVELVNIHIPDGADISGGSKSSSSNSNKPVDILVTDYTPHAETRASFDSYLGYRDSEWQPRLTDGPGGGYVFRISLWDKQRQAVTCLKKGQYIHIQGLKCKWDKTYGISASVGQQSDYNMKIRPGNDHPFLPALLERKKYWSEERQAILAQQAKADEANEEAWAEAHGSLAMSADAGAATTTATPVSEAPRPPVPVAPRQSLEDVARRAESQAQAVQANQNQNSGQHGTSASNVSSPLSELSDVDMLGVMTVTTTAAAAAAEQGDKTRQEEKEVTRHSNEAADSKMPDARSEPVEELRAKIEEDIADLSLTRNKSGSRREMAIDLTESSPEPEESQTQSQSQSQPQEIVESNGATKQAVAAVTSSQTLHSSWPTPGQGQGLGRVDASQAPPPSPAPTSGKRLRSKGSKESLTTSSTDSVIIRRFKHTHRVVIEESSGSSEEDSQRGSGSRPRKRLTPKRRNRQSMSRNNTSRIPSFRIPYIHKIEPDLSLAASRGNSRESSVSGAGSTLISNEPPFVRVHLEAQIIDISPRNPSEWFRKHRNLPTTTTSGSSGSGYSYQITLALLLRHKDTSTSFTETDCLPVVVAGESATKFFNISSQEMNSLPQDLEKVMEKCKNKIQGLLGCSLPCSSTTTEDDDDDQEQIQLKALKARLASPSHHWSIKIFKQVQNGHILHLLDQCRIKPD